MLKRLFGRLAQSQPAIRQEAPAVASSARPTPRRPTRTPGTPVYPAADFGIAYAPVDDVLATQQPLLHRLKLLAALPDDEFEEKYLRVIRNLAIHINHLPASEQGTHNGAGGLFRLALEIGFFAMQASEGRLFAAREGLEERRQLEPRWRYATFLAGICCELHRPITNMIVVNSDGKEWPSFQKSLGEWLGDDDDRFFVRWVSAGKGVGQGASSYLLYKIIPEESLQYLHQGTNQIVPTMLDVITGVATPSERGPMHVIIDEVRAKVFDRDAALRPTQYGKLTVGTHIEPHLLDAMRRLTTDGTWQINAHKARLWYGTDGLFLVWKTAAKEILELLHKDGVTGIPQDPHTLLDLLLKIDVFQMDKDGSPYWTITSPRTGAELLAVRFTSPLTIIAALQEEPEHAGSLLKPTTQAQDATVMAQPIANAPVQAAVANPESPENSAPVVDVPQDQAAPSVAEVQERKTGAELPDDLMASVKPLTRDVLSALLEDHRANRTHGNTGKVPEGFAVGVDQLATYGADVTAVIAELAKAGWIFTPPEKPNKKIHQLQLNSKALQAIILKQSAARDMGFIKQ